MSSTAGWLNKRGSEIFGVGWPRGDFSERGSGREKCKMCVPRQPHHITSGTGDCVYVNCSGIVLRI